MGVGCSERCSLDQLSFPTALGWKLNSFLSEFSDDIEKIRPASIQSRTLFYWIFREFCPCSELEHLILPFFFYFYIFIARKNRFNQDSNKPTSFYLKQL